MIQCYKKAKHSPENKDEVLQVCPKSLDVGILGFLHGRKEARRCAESSATGCTIVYESSLDRPIFALPRIQRRK